MEVPSAPEHIESASTVPHSVKPAPTYPASADPSPSSSYSEAQTPRSPMEPAQDRAIQLIEENKTFNKRVLEHLAGVSAMAEHRIVSVFGSQSTGKSTLLNHLFNTNFGVMDGAARQKTTKGICLAVSPGVNCSAPGAGTTEDDHSNNSTERIVVMDVEGTDGRERGEDQDFERKAALFALATSEVLIVNLWETQVGWYQGANMGLMKTVFEVNLSLFGRAKLDVASDHKVLLLFVIRDHTGVTSLDSLSDTLTRDLTKIWDSLNKPAELAHFRFADFFDLAFHTLSHKIFQYENFQEDVRRLGDRFVHKDAADYLFRLNYRHNVPIEGWTIYAQSCWDQIEHNKDLDLPTQQIMVARIKCEEAAAQAFASFDVAFHDLHDTAVATVGREDTLSYAEIGQQLAAAEQHALANYDAAVSKYNAEVYRQRRSLLREKLVARLQDVVQVYAELLNARTVDVFRERFNKRPKGTKLIDAHTAVRQPLMDSYEQNMAELSLNGLITTTAYRNELNTVLLNILAEKKLAEVNFIANKYVRKLSSALGAVVQSEVSRPSERTWDNIKAQFERLRESLLASYCTAPASYDFGVGPEPELTEVTMKTLEFKSWEALRIVLEKYMSKEKLVAVLKDRFDEKFGYDANGNPRVYLSTRELESVFGAAKTYAVEAIPYLAVAVISDGTKFQPSVNLSSSFLRQKYENVATAAKMGNFAEEDDSDSDDDTRRSFVEVVSEDDQQEVLRKFKRETDAIFVARKGMLVQSRTHIPYYIYLVILVLGWNEFLAIVRSPVVFTVILLVGAAVYGMYQTNLLGPVVSIGERMLEESIAMAKQKFREILIDDHEYHAHNLQQMSRERGERDFTERESIELDEIARTADSE